MKEGAYQVHVDVTEMARRHRYVLGQCLNVAVYLGPLAVQAGSRPGGDIRRQSFSYVPGGDEAAGCPHTRVGGPMQVVEYLPAEVPLAECTCGGVADEVADLLCDNLQTCAGAECLYLGTEDLAEGHVSEV
jgi:hypothetical protein